MKAVVAIKDVEVIKTIKEYLMSKSRRDYMIFYLGIHTDLNINDLLELKVNDVKGKDFIQLSKREVIIPDSTKDTIRKYCRSLEENGYLFHSISSSDRPLHRNTVYKMMKDIEARFGLEDLGCQSLRKTFWYHLSILIAKEYAR
ncbi:MAG: tyrosine-type recombinase/integrase [Clostridiales bacterium]|nr:tyrosine-type recombinase/integrase [Clostridiales bacterium]